MPRVKKKDHRSRDKPPKPSVDNTTADHSGFASSSKFRLLHHTLSLDGKGNVSAVVGDISDELRFGNGIAVVSLLNLRVDDPLQHARQFASNFGQLVDVEDSGNGRKVESFYCHESCDVVAFLCLPQKDPKKECTSDAVTAESSVPSSRERPYSSAMSLCSATSVHDALRQSNQEPLLPHTAFEHLLAEEAESTSDDPSKPSIFEDEAGRSAVRFTAAHRCSLNSQPKQHLGQSDSAAAMVLANAICRAAAKEAEQPPLKFGQQEEEATPGEEEDHDSPHPASSAHDSSPPPPPTAAAAAAATSAGATTVPTPLHPPELHCSSSSSSSPPLPPSSSSCFSSSSSLPAAFRSASGGRRVVLRPGDMLFVDNQTWLTCSSLPVLGESLRCRNHSQRKDQGQEEGEQQPRPQQLNRRELEQPTLSPDPFGGSTSIADAALRKLAFSWPPADPAASSLGHFWREPGFDGSPPGAQAEAGVGGGHSDGGSAAAWAAGEVLGRILQLSAEKSADPPTPQPGPGSVAASMGKARSGVGLSGHPSSSSSSTTTTKTTTRGPPPSADATDCVLAAAAAASYVGTAIAERELMAISGRQRKGDA